VCGRLVKYQLLATKPSTRGVWPATVLRNIRKYVVQYCTYNMKNSMKVFNFIFVSKWSNGRLRKLRLISTYLPPMHALSRHHFFPTVTKAPLSPMSRATMSTPLPRPSQPPVCHQPLKAIDTLPQWGTPARFRCSHNHILYIYWKILVIVHHCPVFSCMKLLQYLVCLVLVLLFSQ
jgi:hypothetical protein